MKRIILFNLVAVVVIFGLAEIYIERTRDDAEGPAARLEFDNPDDYHVRDEDLGYRGAADYHSEVRFYYEDEKIFDVVYTTDSDGLRTTPDSGSKEPCVLFFGGSYTFGAGVDDADTMPNVVARTSGRVVRNLGFSGYGPHQMLASLESGFVERVARCEPSHAIYLAQPHHVLRAAGKFRSDRYGPRFRLRDGQAVREGNFHDDQLADSLYDLFERSSVATHFREHRHATDEDVELYHAIVERSARLLAQRYPGIEFHVLYWDNGVPEIFTDPGHRRGLEVHLLSGVLPLRDRERLEADYQIPYDGHPNRSAHAAIAAYVVDEILRAR